MGNKKPSTGFHTDKNRASLAGKKSSRALPQEIKDARKINATLFENTVYKYMDKSAKELSQIANDPVTPARDLVIIKLLSTAISNGNIHSLNLLLDRTIGRVQDNLKIEGDLTVRSLHDRIIEKLENDD